MSNNSSGCELGKAGKRRRAEEDEDTTTIDRLSRLPKPIIHHILSFLDTKSAIRTSVVSRAWRCAWKYLSVLKFRSDSFQQYSSFKIYVHKVLCLRFPLSVHKVTYVDHGDYEEQDVSLFGRVFEYALCHGAQHLAMDLNNAVDYHLINRFSDLFVPISNCSLRTLELEFVGIDGGFRSFGFQMLTTLKLELCLLSFDEEDFFSNFHSLQNLALIDCPIDMLDESLKVHGLQLLSLDLERVNFCKIEIVSPKLKRFCFAEDWDHSTEFPELSLPSLDHAEIYVSRNCEEKKKEWVEQTLISLFQGLHNAETLTLYGVVQLLSAFDEVLEKQRSPFTRLKHLKLLRAFDVPYKVVDYFLSGSCFPEPIVEFL